MVARRLILRPMSFDVAAGDYCRFMGRYSEPLAVSFVEESEVRPGHRALDVGCGPGALTARLVARLGEEQVAAIDPSPLFVAAVRARCPGVDIREGSAEQLPFPDDSFDVTLAQLVVHFMTDPVAGLQEMRRVTRSAGRVAACVWDHAGGGSPLTTFWTAVRDLDGTAQTESELAGARQGHLLQLFEAAGLRDPEELTLTVDVPFASFEDWWQPYTLGVGPAGAYVAQLTSGAQEALAARCAELLPPAPFTVTASAWCVRARI